MSVPAATTSLVNHTWLSFGGGPSSEFLASASAVFSATANRQDSLRLGGARGLGGALEGGALCLLASFAKLLEAFETVRFTPANMVLRRLLPNLALLRVATSFGGLRTGDGSSAARTGGEGFGGGPPLQTIEQHAIIQQTALTVYITGERSR